MIVRLFFRCLAIMLFLGLHARGEAIFIPGFDRIAAKGDLAAAGELLLGELGCINCHKPSARTADRFTSYRGPDLTGAGERLNPSFVKAFLANPSRVQPGTRMPAMFSGLPEETKAARIEELTRVLSAMRDTEAEPPPERLQTQESIQAGRELFHTIGCAACHQPEKGYRPPGADAFETVLDSYPASVPLSHAGGKYQPGAMARFLENPLLVRPSGRMPAIPLTREEAENLEAYLARNHEPADAGSARRSPVASATDLRVLAEFGCISCHAAGGAVPAEPLVQAKELEELAPNAELGCLSGKIDPGVPHYTLNPLQVEALKAALSGLKSAEALSSEARLERKLNVLNCYACHSRGEVQGPDVSRHPFFTSAADDLGDEGRFPPPLDDSGAKFIPEALYKILLGEGAVRPYMNTRMPGFGPEHAARLTELFGLADEVPAEHPPVVGRNALGRELVGDQGLNCITCHSLNGHPSLGVPALDLASAPARLRPQWFREHLMDPSRFRPGTRMPSFWPDGKGVHPAAGGKPIRQIDSIWVYLNEIDQTRLPSGMENPADFVLVPKERPIVFRTFMEGAGMHAIAVGFPEMLHAAFDSRELRWALLWKGEFLDAEGTWDDRFAPLAQPLGSDILRFPAGPGFAILASVGEPWPRDADSRQFKGYRLGADGRPVFIYHIGGVEIRDVLGPAGKGKILRSIEIRANSQAPGRLWFRAAAGTAIEEKAGGFAVDGRWHTRIEGGSPLVRSSESQQELLVPIRFEKNKAHILQEIAW